MLFTGLKLSIGDLFWVFGNYPLTLNVRKLANIRNETFWEVIFQVTLLTVIFLFYSFDKRAPHFQEFHFAFFANYALASLVINYVLLPRLFYQEKYLLFLITIFLVVLAVILMEELVLEKIYFPERRGRDFRGLLSFIDVMPVIMILFGMKFGWDIIKKQREVDKLRGLMETSELSFLKSQINPHFLFNNLNNLYAYALENSPKTPVIILELSAVLRYMLYECKEQYVSLRNELNQLNNFVKLSELQIEERGAIKFSAPDHVSNDLMIAPLILMVFVENAFKHSAASQTEDIHIDIDVEVYKDQVLYFSCINSYYSISNTENTGQGIGLENVRKRLSILYPNKHKLTIKDENNIYQVTLTIELQ